MVEAEGRLYAKEQKIRRAQNVLEMQSSLDTAQYAAYNC